MTEVAGHNTRFGDGVKSAIAQIVMSEREKAAVSTDIKELYAAAKEHGYNTKAIRKAVKLSMLSPTKRQELDDLEEIVDQYMHATGLLD